jgi:hypothetical protein
MHCRNHLPCVGGRRLSVPASRGSARKLHLAAGLARRLLGAVTGTTPIFPVLISRIAHPGPLDRPPLRMRVPGRRT